MYTQKRVLLSFLEEHADTTISIMLQRNSCAAQTPTPECFLQIPDLLGPWHGALHREGMKPLPGLALSVLEALGNPP